MDMEELWSKTREVLRAEVNAVVYNSLLGSNNLVPALLDGDTLVLRVVMDNLKLLITNQWYSTIVRALSQVAGHQMDVEILTQEEIEARPQLKQKAVEEQETVLESSVALNPKYTFETFVTGSSNRFAHAAAMAVAESPGKVYNPFFMYGGVGLGKTHLMHAIGNRVLQNHPEMRVLYVSSEQFTNEIIRAIQEGKAELFRQKYRTIDVLMVDDIQFLSGKQSTQEEFFNTFNALHVADKQIILSSDRPPREVQKLEDRLRSRFEGGLITDIQAPDLETRIAILKNKALLDHVDVPNDVLMFIANRIDSNIRELEGALTRVVAYASLIKKPVTTDVVAEALKDVFPNNHKKEVTLEVIQEIVATYFKIRIEDLHSKKRTRSIAFPRQIAMYLCRELTDTSLPQIGNFFGGRDHTTVLHAYDKIAKEREENAKLHKIIKDLIESIQKM